jgi:hypothetical protein
MVVIELIVNGRASFIEQSILSLTGRRVDVKALFLSYAIDQKLIPPVANKAMAARPMSAAVVQPRILAALPFT